MQIRKILIIAAALLSAAALTACGDEGSSSETQARETVAQKSDIAAAQELVESINPASEFADKQVNLDAETVQTAVYTSDIEYSTELSDEVTADKSKITLAKITVKELLYGGWSFKDADSAGKAVNAEESGNEEFGTSEKKSASLFYTNIKDTAQTIADCTVSGVALIYGNTSSPSAGLSYDGLSEKSDYSQFSEKLGRPKTVTIESGSGGTTIEAQYENAVTTGDSRPQILRLTAVFSFNADKNSTELKSFTLNLNAN